MSSALISSADASRIAIPAEDEDVAALRQSVVAKLTYAVGRDPVVATDRDWFMAAALAVRDHVVDRWMASTRSQLRHRQRKRVYYLSLEFLIGRLLRDALNNLGLIETACARRSPSSASISTGCATLEPDAALGNGGLGRLAACFMESMATLGIPAYGYGIRYDHGLFRQEIQRRLAGRDARRTGCPSAIPGSSSGREVAYEIGFGGTVEAERRRGRHAAPRLAAGRDGASRSPTTRRSSAGAAGTSTRCGCGRRARRRPAAARRLQPRRPCRRAGRPRPGRGDLARALSRATRRRPARSCGCARNISSPPPRCRTSSRRHLQQYRRHPHAARQGRDPAQRHASGDRGRRADAAPDRRARAAVGRGLADHHARPSPTPTTRCCPRRWRAGRCR